MNNLTIEQMREAFEKQTHLTLYIANLVFDEKDDRYIPNENLIRTFEEWEWKAFSNQAWGVNLAWWAWQSRQAEVDLINATHDGQMIGHDIFVKQLKERHEKQVQGLAKAISKFEKEMDDLQSKIDAVEHILGCAMIGPPQLFQYADRIAKALRGEDK